MARLFELELPRNKLGLKIKTWLEPLQTAHQNPFEVVAMPCQVMQIMFSAKMTAISREIVLACHSALEYDPFVCSVITLVARSSEAAARVITQTSQDAKVGGHTRACRSMI